MAEEGGEIEQAIRKVLNIFNIEELKNEQKGILHCLLARNNCMAILPTGYGKSLPYQMFPLVNREIAPDEAHKVIICSPLIALMEDQVSKLKKIPGVKAEYKGCSPQTDDNIRSGEVDLIFASPESLVGDTSWREELQKLSVGLIVIDEFHTIASWGGDEELEEAAVFRKWFRHVGELRSMFPSALVLALSATCTNKVKKRVVKVMDLHPDTTKFFTITPNKSNIKLVVKKMDNTMESAMYWLIEALQSEQERFPKCIVYANSISEVSRMYNYVCKELCCCQHLFDMYHSETTQEKKTSILEALCDSDSTIRIVFATSALGMGIDVRNCTSVILYGPPRTAVDLLQEVGRAGRDGEKSAAILLYNSYHLRNIDKDLKTVFTSGTCRRIQLMSSFLQESELTKLEHEESKKHTCCDLCEIICNCGECKGSQHLLKIEELVANIDCTSSDSDTVDYEHDMDVLNTDDELSDYDSGTLEDIDQSTSRRV